MNAERGDKGERGVAGERGAKGDHGQDGKKGVQGEPGVAAPYLDRKKTLALFAFVVLAFVVLAVRTESNTQDIQKGVYEVCIAKADVDNVKSDCEQFR